MILADTSIWIDHLRLANPTLAGSLSKGLVVIHSFVIGELAMGSLKDRKLLVQSLSDLPAARQAEDDEVLAFVEASKIHGRGIGYLDAHLLASARLTAALLWTRDRRLSIVAKEMGLAAMLPSGPIQ
jgi:predicted nucleic acid-binding protein